METLKNFEKNHKVLSNILKFFFILITISFIFFVMSDTADVTKKNEEKAIVNATSTEARISLITSSVSKIKYEFVKYEVSDNKPIDNRPENTKYAFIEINVKDIYTKESLHRDTGKITSKIFDEVFKSEPNLTDIIVNYTGELTDTYGKKKTSSMITHKMDRNTNAKIAYDNFASDKLCEFLRNERDLRKADTDCDIFVTNLR